MTLMLPAPAKFRLNKSIRVPTVKACARALDRIRLRRVADPRDRYSWGPTATEKAAEIKDAEVNLDLAEWIQEYVAQHDCNPRIVEMRKDDWGSKRAKVLVEDAVYRVSVAMGRRARGMYGKNGHEWNLYVTREGASKTLVSGERVAKSEGLGAAAVRQHLLWKHGLARGRKVI